MRTPSRFLLRVSAILAAFSPVLAFAHPGHDGEHDVTWSFSHLVEHPIATLGCTILVAGGAWAAWRFAQRSSDSREEKKSSRDL